MKSKKIQIRQWSKNVVVSIRSYQYWQKLFYVIEQNCLEWRKVSVNVFVDYRVHFKIVRTCSIFGTPFMRICHHKEMLYFAVLFQMEVFRVDGGIGTELLCHHILHMLCAKLVDKRKRLDIVCR